MAKILDAVVLTDDYADNRVVVSNLRNQGQVVLWLDYTKDTDSGLQILTEFEISDNADIPATDTYVDSQVDMATGRLTDMVYSLAATAKRVLPIVKPMHADRVRVSVKTVTPGGSAGLVTVYLLKDNEYHPIS